MIVNFKFYSMRKPRIFRPTSFYHVLLRGNNGQDIFFSDMDRCRLCLIIQQGIERYNHHIHGFCFMTNHIHLIIQTGTTPLSIIMHHLGSNYARYINRIHKRIGHLFQGRFKAILIDAQDYLLELVRYVHLNPVRAGVVALPEQYLWSGHLAYIGVKEISWLYQDWILTKFHQFEIPARQLYIEYVKKGIGEKSRDEFYQGSHEGRILGNDSFFESVIEKINNQKSISLSLNILINIALDTLKIPLIAIKSNGKTSELTQARGIIALLVREQGHLSMKELALILGKHRDSLIRLAGQIEKKTYENNELAQLIHTVRTNISLL